VCIALLGFRVSFVTFYPTVFASDFAQKKEVKSAFIKGALILGGRNSAFI
jgi:hypothetical protein